MKKLLLSFVALFACICANAFEVTFDGTGTTWTSSAAAQTETKDGVTMTCENGLYSGHYRFYKSKTLTFTSTAGKIVSVEFTCTASGTNNYGPGGFSTTNGEYTYDGSKGSWVGSTESLVLTATNSQVRATKVVVTIQEGGSDSTSIASPRIRPSSGKYYEAQEVTFTSNNSVFYSINDSVNYKEYNANDTTNHIMLTNPGIYVVRAYATDGSKKSAVVTNTIEIAVLPAYTTFADAKAAATTTSTPCKFTFDNAVVAAASASNAYLQDASGNVAIIYTSNHGLTQGQTISGTITTNFQLYYGTLEFTGITKDTKGLTFGEATPKVTTMSLEDLSTSDYGKLITIKGVTYSDGKFSQTTDDTYYITPYKTFMTLPEFREGKNYDITGIALYYISNNVTTLEISPRSEADIVLLTSQKEQTITVTGNKTALQAGETDVYPVVVSGTGAISVTSSNDTIASARYADGNITVVANQKGEATITIKAAENDDYLSAEMSYVVKVTNAGEYEAIWVAKDQADYANAAEIDTVNAYKVDANISILFDKNGSKTSPKYYTTGTGARLYYDNTMTISAANGYAVAGVKINYTGSSYNGMFTSNVGTCSTDSVAYQTWTNSEPQQSVVLTCSTTCRILDVVITYVKSDAPATLPGDANGDGAISVADLSLMATYILSGEAANINLANADANGDGSVTVADISLVASKILGGGSE